jgi:transposase
VSTERTVDTQEPGLAVRAPRKKLRRRSIKERREIVEETLLAGASVSRVARRHDVNANQVFYWRKLYREGRLGSKQLLAVEVSKERSAAVTEEAFASSSGTIEIQLAKGSLRVFGSIDVAALRVVLECLAG